MLEDFTDTLVGLCGTFKILIGTDLLAHFLTLHTSVSHGRKRAFYKGYNVCTIRIGSSGNLKEIRGRLPAQE